MSLTLLGLVLMPLYLKGIVDPKGSYKAFTRLMKSDEAMTAIGLWMLLLATIILSSTGLNFAWEWSALLAWLGLLVGLKGVLYMLVPGFVKQFEGMISQKSVPFWSFFGLIFAILLIYADANWIA